jgi:putative addiction module component (TIGR02574 family)
MDLATFEQQALALPAEERAILTQHLIASLDQDAEIEEAWAAEVERRVAEVESGAVQVIPIAEALAQVRSSLR